MEDTWNSRFYFNWSGSESERLEDGSCLGCVVLVVKVFGGWWLPRYMVLIPLSDRLVFGFLLWEGVDERGEEGNGKIGRVGRLYLV